MTLPPTPSSVSPRRHSLPERIVERTIFASRWLLAPVYLGLVGGLVVLMVDFAGELYALFSHLPGSGGKDGSDRAIMGVLALIDLSLMGSLVVTVMFAGYENFVSRLEVPNDKDRPSWMGHVDFGDLKLKLMASIVAISAIQVLESFMNMDQLSDRHLAWSVGIHMSFVVSAVLLALMDRMTGKSHASD